MKDIRVSRHHQCLQSALTIAGTIYDGYPVHFRHRVVYEQEIYGPLPFDYFEGLVRGLGFPDSIALASQNRTDKVQHAPIIVAHQDLCPTRLNNRLVGLGVKTFER